MSKSISHFHLTPSYSNFTNDMILRLQCQWRLTAGRARVGTSPNFSSPSRARALSVEAEQARACPNYPRACFEPELFTNKNAEIRDRAYLEHFGKALSLGLIYCESKIWPGHSSPSPGSFHLTAGHGQQSSVLTWKIFLYHNQLLLWYFDNNWSHTHEQEEKFNSKTFQGLCQEYQREAMGNQEAHRIGYPDPGRTVFCWIWQDSCRQMEAWEAHPRAAQTWNDVKIIL